MKTNYDAATDALYVRFAETPIEGSEEVAPGIIFDCDAEHRLVAIEVLNARAKLTEGAVLEAAQ
jgi:uncharacterized protein YuzE